MNLLFGGVDVAPVEDVAAGAAIDLLRAIDVRAVDVVLQQEEEDEAQDGGGQNLKVYNSCYQCYVLNLSADHLLVMSTL